MCRALISRRPVRVVWANDPADKIFSKRSINCTPVPGTQLPPAGANANAEEIQPVIFIQYFLLDLHLARSVPWATIGGGPSNPNKSMPLNLKE
jgi:hypothetical protein